MLLPVAVLACLTVTSGGPEEKPLDPTFSSLPPDLVAHMDKQRAFVAQLVAQHLPGERVARTRSDLAVLQKIVNAKLIPRDATWQLQSLGVVFGDALTATVDGLAWRHA